MISKNHSNRSMHNWLIYDISDRFLQNHVDIYKGILYDLGCGEAPYRRFFLKHTDQYIGVDWSGSNNDTNAIVLADLNKTLPFKSGVADTVVSLSVIEHLHEPQNMLNEAFRILKPNGWMILQVPWQWQIHEAPYDFFRYTPYGLHHLFQKAGFVDITVEPQAGFFTMMTLKINYFSLRLIRGPRLLRTLTRGGLVLFWHLGQKLAPLLDKIDKDWALEATGYFVTARKP